MRLGSRGLARRAGPQGFAQRMASSATGSASVPVYLCFDMDVFDPSVAMASARRRGAA